MMTMMTLPFVTVALSAVLAQVPDPTPAINAAKNAKAQTEAAQQKNAEALDQKPAPAPAPAAGAPAPASSAPAPQAGSGGAGYTYDPAGRRDPFVSLTARGGDLPPAGSRPSGPPGLLVSEITLKGVLKSPKGFLALVQAPDNRTYIMHAGDKVLTGP